jgi:hypothetical protein
MGNYLDECMEASLHRCSVYLDDMLGVCREDRKGNDEEAIEFY